MNEQQFIHQIIRAAKEFASEAVKAEEEKPNFYCNIDKDYAAAIIDEIIEMTGSAKAVKLIELFVNNLMTVEEIEMIIF